MMVSREDQKGAVKAVTYELAKASSWQWSVLSVQTRPKKYGWTCALVTGVKHENRESLE